jgi:hypothetical protein
MLNGSLESCRLTGAVRLGDEKLGQMGLRTRSNHQNWTVRRLRRASYSKGDAIFVWSEWNSRLSGKCRLNALCAISHIWASRH